MPKARMAAIAAGTAVALLAGAGAAAAAPRPNPGPQQVRAQTLVADRPDGGNGSPDPYWADDTFTRGLTITLTGGTPGDWTFTATIADMGTFTTIPREQTPNQAPPYTGDVIGSRVTGIMNGRADYSFTASELPSAAPNAGVTAYENDHGNVPSDSTSTWYELAFPAGTTFGGAGIGDWSWSYVAFAWPVFQGWVDASGNGGGDLAGDGNIEG
jgi:hypothetical protein